MSSCNGTRVKQRAWWRDMKKSDAEEINRMAETAKGIVALLEEKLTKRMFLPERCEPSAYDKSPQTRARKEILPEEGPEQYEGQKAAYRTCSSITEYIGNLEQINLLTVLRYGIMQGHLTFPVETEDGMMYHGHAACLDFHVDKVTPFLNGNMKVVLDVQITADILYLLIEGESGGNRVFPAHHCSNTYHPRKTQQQYRVQVMFRHKDGSLRLRAINRLDEDKKAISGWPLDPLLVPVVREEETEAFCDFITSYLLKAPYAKRIPTDIRAYHAGMGLPQRHRISEEGNILAKIFFYEGTAVCWDGGVLKEISVYPGTVWIDGEAIARRSGKWHRRTNGKETGAEILWKKSVFHEAFHWYTAAPHFCLLRRMNELNGSAAMCYSMEYAISGDKRKPKSEQPQSPTAYFERLDARCEPRIVMPRRLVRTRAEALKKEQAAEGRSRISWSQIIDVLADEFHSSREAAKYRLIELGYTDAQGARNWVSTMNGGFYCAEYVPPVGMERNQTYEISRLDGLLEHKRNPAFRKLLQTFPFAYVDGHYVIDDPKYIAVKNSGARLTEYALTHMDECCIPFRKIASKRVYNAAYGFLCCETEQVTKSGVMAWEATEEMRKKQREALLFNQEVEEFKKKHQDSDFPTVLNEHMMNSRLSEFQIANRMGISHHTLGKYRTGEAVPDVFTTLTLIIAMELRGGYRRHLFSLLEKKIKDGVEKNIIDSILDSNQYMLPIEEWDALIEEVYPIAFKSGFILAADPRRSVINELKKAGTLPWNIRMLAS